MQGYGPQNPNYHSSSNLNGMISHCKARHSSLYVGPGPIGRCDLLARRALISYFDIRHEGRPQIIRRHRNCMQSFSAAAHTGIMEQTSQRRVEDPLQRSNPSLFGVMRPFRRVC